MQRIRSPGGFPPMPDFPAGMFWRLDGKIAVPVRNMLEFIHYNEHITTSLFKDEIGPIMISTVFLGIAHNRFEGHDPMLFETMAFADGECEHDVYCRRYFTYDEAEKGHGDACEWARRKTEEINQRIKLSDELERPRPRLGLGNHERS